MIFVAGRQRRNENILFPSRRNLRGGRNRPTSLANAKYHRKNLHGGSRWNEPSRLVVNSSWSTTAARNSISTFYALRFVAEKNVSSENESERVCVTHHAHSVVHAETLHRHTHTHTQAHSNTHRPLRAEVCGEENAIHPRSRTMLGDPRRQLAFFA